MKVLISAVLMLLGIQITFGDEPPQVRVMRLPNGGIQPQAVVDDKGTIHVVYFKGEPSCGDLLYMTRSPARGEFSESFRVNTHNTSAVAMGTIRGPQIAIGRGNRPHIAWNPSGKSGLKGMCYTRMADDRMAFEPQRSITAEHFGLDGGGSVAADRSGNVYVVWHAPLEKDGGEADRRVWVARSKNDGKSFAPETVAWKEPTGACGCCGLRVFADSQGNLYVLYRSARQTVNRDTYLLASADHGATFTGQMISPMKIGACIMSSAAMSQGIDGPLAAWETSGQVWWTKIDRTTYATSNPIGEGGEGKGHKHPAIAQNKSGQVLLAWAQGTGWNRGGSLAWQLFGADGNPLPGQSGQAPNLPPWDLPAAAACPDGSFLVFY